MTTQAQVIGNKDYLPVLDKGFVGIVSVMGDDAAIVQAARLSYGAGTKSVNEDRGLIRYLMRRKHTSPIEMCEIKFHVRLPIFVARQWIRHRTASLNEESARYSIMTDEFYFPAREDIQPQSKDNKQGRSGDMSDKDKNGVEWVLNAAYEHSNNAYRTLLGEEVEHFYDLRDEGHGMDAILTPDYPGVAKEVARMVMPTAAYSEMYWKIDLHNLFHFLKLRADPHAQKEIRVFAEAMIELARPHFPVAFEAWEDYSRYARNLSRMEIKLVQSLLQRDGAIFFLKYIEAKESPVKGDYKKFCESYELSTREMDDFVRDFMGVKDT